MHVPSPAAPAATEAGLSPAERSERATGRWLAQIQRKLDCWELLHLREHAAQLATKVEQLEAQLQMLHSRLEHAESTADYWREQVLQLQDELADDLAIGMTVDGKLGLVELSTEAPQAKAA